MCSEAQQKIEAMDQKDLKRLFGKMLKEEGYIPSESMAIFGKLIRLTIEFRDLWKAKKNEILTVEDTRKATSVYVSALKEGRIPENLDEKTAGLVRLWLKEINGKAF